MVRYDLVTLVALGMLSVFDLGCSSSEAGSPTPATDGGGGVDVGGSGALAPGRATMEATFSEPIDGYNGFVTPYAGLEAESKAGGSDGFFQFDTSSANGKPQRRGVFLTVRGTPAAGMTFATAPGGMIPPGTSIRYQELDIAGMITTRVWSCTGSLPVLRDELFEIGIEFEDAVIRDRRRLA